MPSMPTVGWVGSHTCGAQGGRGQLVVLQAWVARRKTGWPTQAVIKEKECGPSPNGTTSVQRTQPAGSTGLQMICGFPPNLCGLAAARLTRNQHHLGGGRGRRTAAGWAATTTTWQHYMQSGQHARRLDKHMPEQQQQQNVL